jgi:hypothetical protein
MANPKLKLGNDIWATKQKSLLAYNDEGGNYKSIPFQVDRISGGTYVGRNGLIQSAASNEPRIDFTSNTKGALLLEPQRTNYALNSNDASQWANVGGSQSITKTANYSIAPDGTQTAARLQASASGSGYSLISLSTTSFVGNYSLSVYLKSNTGNIQNVVVYGRNTSVDAYAIGNDWQRIELQGSGTSGQNLYLFLGSFPNNGSDNTIDVSVWGGQLEAGTYATSIIPTSSAAVTRVIDFTFIPSGLQNILNTSEGTLFVDVDVPRVSSTSSFERIVLSDQNASTDRIIFDNYGGNWRVLMLSSAGIVNRTIESVTANQRIKVAIAYSSTELRISYDGNAATTTTGSYTPSTTLESFKFSNKDGGSKWNGNIYDARYFDSALSNAELVELTS